MPESFLVSLLFVALLDPFDPYSPFKFLIFYSSCVLTIYIIHASLFQNRQFDQILSRIKGIEDQITLLFTSGVAAVLSSSQNSASVSLNNLVRNLTTTTSQPTATRQSGIINQPVVGNQYLSQAAVINQSPATVINPSQPTVVNPSQPTVVNPSQPTVVNPSTATVINQSPVAGVINQSPATVINPSQPTVVNSSTATVINQSPVAGVINQSPATVINQSPVAGVMW